MHWEERGLTPYECCLLSKFAEEQQVTQKIRWLFKMHEPLLPENSQLCCGGICGSWKNIPIDLKGEIYSILVEVRDYARILYDERESREKSLKALKKMDVTP